ncbi:MAG: CheR family methyltransferase [Thermodesulfobacteriota bacterium]
MTAATNRTDPCFPPASAAFGSVQISDTEFHAIRHLVYENFGINLTEQKRSLVVGRLQKFLRQKQFATFDQYFHYVRTDASGQALGELINRISTNHTFFFREQDHFDFFRTVILPETTARLKKERSNDLRVWCAGCSFGDEPYTFMITMLEHFGLDYKNWNAGILATDISAAALSAAKAGVYPEERLKMVPPSLKQKYFRDAGDGTFQVSEILKKEITFRRLNLMKEQFPFRKPFHLISCRNVMIYFDQPTRNALVNRFFEMTAPGGYLFIGHSETLRNDACPYAYIRPAIYRKGGGA